MNRIFGVFIAAAASAPAQAQDEWYELQPLTVDVRPVRGLNSGYQQITAVVRYQGSLRLLSIENRDVLNVEIAEMLALLMYEAQDGDDDTIRVRGE